MEALKKDRANLKRALRRFEKAIADANSAVDVPYLKSALERNLSLIREYDRVQSGIESLYTAEEDLVEEDNDRNKFEREYDVAVGKARSFIDSHERSSNLSTNGSSNSAATQSNSNTPAPSPFPNSDNSNDTAHAVLKRVEIPKFDGNFSKWVKFRDTFNNLVHENSKLSNIQKFTYLEDALTGKAKSSIASFGVSDENYSAAWEKVQSRFEDNIELKQFHLSCIFEAPQLKQNSADDLRDLIDIFENNISTLTQLREPTASWDAPMLYLLRSKLSVAVRKEWEKTEKANSENHTLKDMLTFLESHCKFLLKTKDNSSKEINQNKKGSNKSKTFVVNNSHSDTSDNAKNNIKSCSLCNGTHPLYACNDFKSLSPEQRFKKAHEVKICKNCLLHEHEIKNCKFGPCKKCGFKHNTLLHIENFKNETNQEQAVSRLALENESINDSSIINHKDSEFTAIALASNKVSTYVLLGTALIDVYDQFGNAHECRALLDSCSQPHLLTTSFWKKLKTPMHQAKTTLSGIEHGEAKLQGQTTIKISSRYSKWSKILTCLVLDNIDNEAPSRRLSSCQIDVPPGIQLADPLFNLSRPVDLLIGAAFFYELLCVGQIKLKSHQPVFQKTVLGWVAAGQVLFPEESKCNLIRNSDLNNQMEKFWAVENCYDMPINRLAKNDPAEIHFRKTVQRDESGKFIVSIPIKNDEIYNLGLSRDMAFKRLISTEKRLARNPEQNKQYVDFMNEYELLGHMTEIPLERVNDNQPHFYLPHHAVFKENSTTTKVRVVFDGSAKTSTGVSLNNIQHIGTPSQDDLFSIVLRFRLHEYIISADIAKMYRQILLQPDERALQRILWRKDPKSEVKTFELNTVTYGTASAPFLATRCLHELGIIYEERFPKASKIVQQDFYVDDLLTGGDSIEEVKQLKSEITTIISSAGMELRKWASNDPQIINSQTSSTSEVIALHGDKDPKTLGLHWDPCSDTLKYVVQPSNFKRITKSSVLSTIMQIYDPLGLVGPAIIPAKVMMQRLWSIDLDWDESLPQELHTTWEEIRKEITDLNKISIKRKVRINTAEKYEYHGFCDASERAYGACIYVCSVSKDGTRNAHLLCAKSRVAPTQSYTIPRLELCGAHLLAQLANKVSRAGNISKDCWHFWTDSMINLAWIKSPANKWQRFVAYRVGQIQEMSNSNWNHVPTADNPADLISRGATAQELIEADIWWNGPDWLSRDKSHWPVNINNPRIEIPEQRVSSFFNIIDPNVKVPEQKLTSFVVREINKERSFVKENESQIGKVKSDHFDRFSSFQKLVRVTAYIYRFVNNCKKPHKDLSNEFKLVKNSLADSKAKPITLPLNVSEIKNATIKLLKIAQFDVFPKIIIKLCKGSKLENTNSLKQLNPFLDKSGLLRVGGRLMNAFVSYDQKHPIILPASHKLTNLIVENEHKKLLHGGCQSVLASLRQRFWPIHGKKIVRAVLHKCIPCFKARPNMLTPIMGNLPVVRVKPSRAFHNTSVDYAGPFFIRDLGRGNKKIFKSYMCMFVCLVTKAVHIELAVDLSTEAFLNCFKRFISRRGICKNMYSDNGSNFTGANNELKEIKELLNSREYKNDVGNYFTENEINWHFSPPYAPHFGGLWESAVKSAKYHIKRVVGKTLLTYEELYTLLTQVEACLNSRPLSPLSNDPNDLTPLTPGHFLVGGELTAMPQQDVKDIKVNRLNRYEHIMFMLQHFWKQWHKEYLPQLQARLKWTSETESKLKIGTLVLLQEDNVPPMQWPLGRIVETHPGQDGVIRVVSIKLPIKDGDSRKSVVLKRPVAKISVLPIEEEL